ncbi:MAG: 4Fe-4S dicluster domain-containing protein [Deltaproteobacteria bacterium]|nr:4Fe-4S dicluster domain-containing protein [Deltaproteobacteria bacterium]
MKILKIEKENILPFLEHLASFGELHAPQKKGKKSSAYQVVTDPSKVIVSNEEYTRTILPIKKFFHKPVDKMMTFSPEKGYEDAYEDEGKKVIFGVHSCEINALLTLDRVFAGKYVDTYYFRRRQNTAIIGISCIPDEYCYCHSMGTSFAEEGFDLFLSDVGNAYLVKIGTSLGDDMVSTAESLFTEYDNNDLQEYKRRINEFTTLFTTKVDESDLPAILDMEYKSEIWEEMGNRCFNCGICSMVCPTCFCFDVYDEVCLDGATGERKRCWDSCLFKSHAMVAGGHNFREKRADRFKHRFLHKHQEFMGEFGRPSCVGCGRCTQECPADIHFVGMLKRIKGDISCIHPEDE